MIQIDILSNYFPHFFDNFSNLVSASLKSFKNMFLFSRTLASAVPILTIWNSACLFLIKRNTSICELQRYFSMFCLLDLRRFWLNSRLKKKYSRFHLTWNIFHLPDSKCKLEEQRPTTKARNFYALINQITHVLYILNWIILRTYARKNLNLSMKTSANKKAWLKFFSAKVWRKFKAFVQHLNEKKRAE